MSNFSHRNSPIHLIGDWGWLSAKTNPTPSNEGEPRLARQLMEFVQSQAKPKRIIPMTNQKRWIDRGDEVARE